MEHDQLERVWSGEAGGEHAGCVQWLQEHGAPGDGDGDGALDVGDGDGASGVGDGDAGGNIRLMVIVIYWWEWYRLPEQGVQF